MIDPHQATEESPAPAPCVRATFEPGGFALPRPQRRRGPPRPTGRVEGKPRPRRQEPKSLDPGLRRGDESCPDVLPATEARRAAGKGKAEPARHSLRHRLSPPAGGIQSKRGPLPRPGSRIVYAALTGIKERRTRCGATCAPSCVCSEPGNREAP